VKGMLGQRILRLSDQGLSSLSNFILSVGLARALAPREFGFVSLVVLTSIALMSVTRGTVGEVMLVHVARDQSGTSVPLAGGLKVALLIGSSAMLIGGIFVAFAPPNLKIAVLLITLAFPLIAVQDALRYAFLSKQQSGRACLIDATWVVVCAPAVAVGGSATTMTEAWLLGAFLSMLLGLGATYTAWRTTHSIGAWIRYAGAPCIKGLLADNLLTVLTSVLFSAATLMALDLSSLGLLRKALVPLAPVAVVNTSLAVLLLPERGFASAGRRRLLMIGVGSVAAAPLWGGLLLATGPVSGPLLVGSDWPSVRGYVAGLSLYLGLQALVFVAIIGLKHSSHPFRASAVRMAALFMQTALVLAGSYVSRVNGAIAGLLTAWAVMVPIAWLYWARDIRGRTLAPMAEPWRPRPNSSVP